MFRKVRWKLTLVNVSVVGLILLIFLSGIYFLMKRDTEQQSREILRATAEDIRKRALRPGSPPVRSLRNGFYVVYKSDGTLAASSSDIPLEDAELDVLLRGATQDKYVFGIIKSSSGSYRYFRNISPVLNTMTIVFLNNQLEQDMLARLRAILISVGLAGIVIVFVPSFFLAGRALIPIRKSWERQQNFVADASHELRSPLAVMQTNLELVLDNKEETVESQSKWLEYVQAENQRMAKLVDDLLFLARADSNQLMVEKAIFPLHKVVTEVVDSYRPLAASKNIRLELKIESDIEYFGDEGRLKQLTVILLDNAIKYTPSSGKAEVCLKNHDNHIELIFSDTGIGIAEEHLGKIFDRFFRVDKARSRDSGGTGLGLSIADRIAKEHKGSISVVSSPGEGSTFRVLLPKLHS